MNLSTVTTPITPNIPGTLVFNCISGSNAYGTSTPESDIDTRGIYVPPLEVLLNPFVNSDMVSDNSQDIQIYALQKFIKMLCSANPNVLELLWTPEDCIIALHPAMQNGLIAHRNLFLTKKIKGSYCGYAYSQLKRIKGHCKWINNPQPKLPPSLRNYIKFYGENINTNISQEKLFELFSTCTATKINEHTYKLYTDNSGTLKTGFVNTAEQTQPTYIDISLEKLNEINPKFLGVAAINLEGYAQDMHRWHNYWEWKNNRNEKRAEIEAVCGYDGKHAMHLLRLLRQCKEIFLHKEIYVRRPDAKELLEIRLGKRSYESVIAEADALESEINNLYEMSDLPDEVDLEKAFKIYAGMLKDVFSRKCYESAQIANINF